MDIQIQSGECYQHSEDQGRHPKTAPAEIECGNGRERCAGMAGRKGKVVWPGNEKLDRRIHVAWADTADQGLQHQVAADHLQRESCQYCHSGLSVFWCEEEDPGQDEPDQAMVAQCSDGRHQQIHDRASQVCLDPIQNRKFKREHRRHRALSELAPQLGLLSFSVSFGLKERENKG